MAPGIWSLTLGLVLGIGQFGAVDLPWFWGAAIDETVAAETPISPTLGGHSTTRDHATPEEDHHREGFVHIWGHSVFHFDLYSWIGPAWFSTPLHPPEFLRELGTIRPGQIRSADL